MGVKFKAKQWNITKIKGTKFSDTNRCINIILGSLLQKDVNFGEIGRKVAGSAHKCSETNSSKVCNTNIQQITIKYSNSLADTGYIQQRTLAHQQVHLNVHADLESRNAKHNSEWKLDISVFQEIVIHMTNQLWICLHPDSATNFHDTLHGNQIRAVQQQMCCSIFRTENTVLLFLLSAC